MANKKVEKKVFDVAKPGKGKVDIGSKPMIVGHKSMASDPMMRNDAAEEKQLKLTPDKVSESSKITVVPITEHKESTDSEKIEGAPELPGGTLLKSNLNELENPDIIEDHIIDEQTEKQNDDEVQEIEDTPADQNESSEVDVETDEAIEVEESSNTPSDESMVVDSESTDTKSDSKNKSEEEKKLDPVAVAMERDENLRKLIDNKTYRLDIKESSSNEGGSKKIIIALAAVLVGLIGLFVAIDTKSLDIGVDLPFSIFNKGSKENGTQETAQPANETTTEQQQNVIDSSEQSELTKPVEFSMDVPENWSFSYTDTSNGTSIFHTYVYTLPSGTKLTFADSGGKGGDCTPASTDIPHQANNSCMTTELVDRKDLDVNEVTQSRLKDGQTLAVDKFRITTAKGASRYFLCLDLYYSDAQPLEIGEPQMGFGVQKCAGMGSLGYLTDIAGPDDSEKSFFDNKDIKEIEQVLSTFELL